MDIRVINPLIQFGRIEFDFVSSDPNGVIPDQRVSTSLPMSPVPGKAEFVAAIKRCMLGVYLSTPEDQSVLRDAMFYEYYRPVAEHSLAIDRPAAYPTLGA